MRRRLAERRDAPGGEHDERLRQTGRARRLGERLEVARGDRREIRVRSGRRRALVLAELGRNFVRGDNVHARMAPAQLVRDRALVRRVAEREQQTHGDRLGVTDVGDLSQRL